jgi:hypothetical protein
LASAVEEVLETMCFATVLASSEGTGPPPAPEDGAPAAAPAITLSAELNFHGGIPGRFRLRLPLNLARGIAAGFLGRDETEVSDTQAREVAGELANMICGSVLSRLEGEATFNLSHPEVTESEPGRESDGAGAHRWFELGDGLLVTSLELQQAA